MPDTLVKIKGILNDIARDDEHPNILTQMFVVRHETQENFNLTISRVLDDIKKSGGLMIMKDELKSGSDYNNLKLVPLHMFARIEFETKLITGNYPQGGEGVKQ